MKPDRRGFLKSSAAGAAGILLGGGELKSFQSYRAWSPGMQISSAIDNLRVVYCQDPAMVSKALTYPQTSTSLPFISQNSALNDSQIRSDLDTLACALTQKSTPSDAWRTIFRSAKPWNQTKVAIKCNTMVGWYVTHVPIINKIIDVLTGFGVLPGNICLYDGNDKNFISTYENNSALIRPGVLCNAGPTPMGGRTKVSLPGLTGDYECLTQIANGTWDIIVNLALNKGQDRSAMGKVSLCMKNHYGTFNPRYDFDREHAGLDTIIGINKSDQIIGGSYPRQQLCILDSIWGVGTKNTINFQLTHQPSILVMGTFAPAIDYQVIHKIREAMMDDYDHPNTDRLITDFGYATTDPRWIPHSA